MSGTYSADSFLFLLYFVAQIILSYAVVQANFLQAAVDYKKKIGFKGILLWFTCANFPNSGIAPFFPTMTEVLLFQEHCW